MTEKRELLLGCGSNRDKKMHMGNDKWENLTTIDHNRTHKPDWVWDLRSVSMLPFEDETFDEIHAYEVLEHIHNQGDAYTFFKHWNEYWRLLKPGGYFFATTPAPDSPWVWGDPSHTAQYLKETLIFLHQPAYTEQVGKTPMSDFRNLFVGDFDIKLTDYKGGTFFFALQAVKPSRVTTP